MKRFHLATLVASSLVAVLLFGAGTVRAAAAPEVTSVIEGRDAGTDRAVLVLLGKNLTKFTGFTLSPAGGGPSLAPPELLSAAKTMLVLGLPPAIAPGEYVLGGLLGAGPPATFEVRVQNGKLDWTGLTGVPAGFADGVDGDAWTVSEASADNVFRPIGRVAIGTDNPSATLEVLGDDGVLLRGTLGAGSIPAEGAGTRAMWYPAKAAFRAGTVAGQEWDSGNIGIGSFATGNGSKANGDFAVAAGKGTEASGTGSLATGAGTVAAGAWSLALGQGTTAKGDSSAALGSATNAAAELSVAMGESTTAVAYGSLVLGRFNKIEGATDKWTGSDPVLVVGNGKGDDDKDRTNAFTLRQNGDLSIAGSLTEASDARLKEDVAPLTGVLARLAGLRAVSYRFRDGTPGPAGRHIGLLAQEVRNAFPELVEEDSRGSLSVAYGKFSAVLLEAVREQQAALDDRDREIEALRRELAATRAGLEERLALLEGAPGPRK